MSDSSFYSLVGPLDPTPAERQVRAANLTGFGELVRSRGGDPRRLLEQHGIDPRALRDPDAFVDNGALIELFEHCARAFGDPLFGLHLAQMQEPDLFGAIATLCRSASSMREALGCFVEFIPVAHCPAVRLQLLEQAGSAELRWTIRREPGASDQASFKGTMMTLKLLRQLGGPAFQPSRIELAVDARGTTNAEIGRLFGCPFRAGAEINLIAFPVSLLDQPVVSANRLLFRLLGGYFERVRDAARRSLVDRVEDYVRGSLPTGNCSVEHCARTLGTPVRTLQAGLSGHGLRFSDIVERQRRDVALSYLEDGEITLDDLAAQLGYSEQSSFGRAFKRWTGSSPQGYRRRLDLKQAA